MLARNEADHCQADTQARGGNRRGEEIISRGQAPNPAGRSDVGAAKRRSLEMARAFRGFGKEEKMSITSTRFWVVWSPQGSAPVVRHASNREATDEAHRLARKHPDREFHVLVAEALFRAVAVEEVQLF